MGRHREPGFEDPNRQAAGQSLSPSAANQSPNARQASLAPAEASMMCQIVHTVSTLTALLRLIRNPYLPSGRTTVIVFKTGA